MRPIFFFDVGSPYAYLTAERIEDVLGTDPYWQPVLLGGLFKLNGRSSWAAREPELRAQGIAEVERRAAAYGLPPVKWPDPWPLNYLYAMRVATHADMVGRGREFGLTALRMAFRDGVDLSQPDAVLDAAEAAGLDRAEAGAAADDPEVKERLRDATDVADAAGAPGVPAVLVGTELFWGDDRLEDAARMLGDRAHG